MHENRIIRIEELQQMIGGIHRTTLRKWEESGKFPKRIKLGARSMGWVLKDIQEWIESRRN